MIDFKPITYKDKELYTPYLLDGIERGCEHAFANLCIWGNQNAAIVHGHMVLLSHFNELSIYPYPAGVGDKKPVLDAIIVDAKERGIPCRISSLYGDAVKTIQELYPDRFRFTCSRDMYDYVYDINDLADLKGRKYHRKRNHLKRFQNNFPDYHTEPLNGTNIIRVRQMIDEWYRLRLKEAPDSDFDMERIAIEKALSNYKELGMEGLVLLNEETVLAVTLGSQMTSDTFDVHFEKARPDIDGAYTAINCEYARYIRDKHPHIHYLDREEDMGIEGLRKSKESYYPHHMIEKCYAILKETDHAL